MSLAPPVLEPNVNDIPEELMELPLNRYELILRFEEEARMPFYPGSVLRGSFGHAFRKVACPFQHKDGTCPMGERCLYLRIFETPPPPGSEVMRKYPAAPHPFVINPVWDGKRTYQPGDRLTFGLLLIGETAQYLPYFVYAFQEQGRIGLGNPRASYTLDRVLRLTGAGHKEEIYRHDEGILRNSGPTQTARDAIKGNRLPDPCRLTIYFETPTRVKYEERLATRPEFHILIRNLLRRISLITYFHGGFQLELPYRDMIEAATKVELTQSQIRWVDWERYSSRQDTRMKLGGFIGTATYQGNISQFLPYLRLGEWLHVGKGTTFGLGRYDVKGGGSKCTQS